MLHMQVPKSNNYMDSKTSIIFADDESLFSQNYRSFFQAAAAVRVPRGVLASAVEQN